MDRRRFLRAAGAGLAAGAAAVAGARARTARAQETGERPPKPAGGVRVVNPRGRVPLSFIIDDSTCLVNLAYYGIPQFHEVFPDRYRQDWRRLPREIPDDFVREFGEWCGERGVKGKYSIVPYPACVGWMDRGLPGWSHRDLEASLRLVRELMLPGWDIHPEMVSHTRVVNVKTGRPYPEASPAYMENWGWSQDKSAEVLTEYMAYALQILKNVDLPCEGITTPGGFGHRNRANLARATLESCRRVFKAEIPHYFRDLYARGDRSVAPQVYLAEGLDAGDPRCVVSIIGCTGDWFGGWDGLTPGSVDRFITEDLKQGRLVEVIDRGEPAILVCHWPGIYYNGEKLGFNIFKEIVKRLGERYDCLRWMKLSEIARYWAAKELTALRRDGPRVTCRAPFAAPGFTVAVTGKPGADPAVEAGGNRTALKRAASRKALGPGTWVPDGDETLLCFDLPKGASTLRLG
jgi:hypothetical protein